jgi:peptidyl-prolyl cis-trans isomerase SurA
LAAALVALLAMPAVALPAAPPPSSTDQITRIVAVVNGDVISNADVDNRARLFAVSTGLPLTPEVIGRLKSQITRQLIDERLRMQEAQRRKIVIPDKQIADAIHGIETRNGLPAGGLRQKLQADGVSQLTLIDQIRTQLGWGQVLREQLGDQVKVSDAEVA